MPRKKKPVEAAVEAQSRAVNSMPAVAETTEFGPVSPPAAGADESQKTWAPRGPLWFLTVQLSSTNGGPRMRLGRDNRFNQMAISFDEKPTENSRRRLHDGGWKWRQAEGQWTKQLEIDHRATGQQDAEKLFGELAKIERRDRQIGEEVAAIRH